MQGMMDAGSNQKEKGSRMTFMLLALLVVCVVMLFHRKRCRWNRDSVSTVHQVIPLIIQEPLEEATVKVLSL